MERASRNIRVSDGVLWGLLLGLGLAYWSWVLWPYYGIPSQDDGLNHLAYIRFLREARTWTLGHVPFPHGAEFGAGNLVFYPAGMHAFMAVIGGDPAFLLQAAAVLALALLPAILFRGIRSLEPELDSRLAWLLAASMGTLLIFPAAPLGEGGLPRILAQVGALPIAFAALSRRMGTRGLAAVLALATPVLFYVHPSSFFVLFPAVFIGAVKPRASRGWILLAAAAAIGALLCLAPMATGSVNPSQFGMAGEGTGSGAIGLAAVWDRLKGVFHYFFSDPHGLLKFMSIRSIAAYLGIYCLARDPRRRSLLWIVLVPFALSLCTLVPSSLPIGLLRAPGAVFYQFVKRIAEIGLLPLVLLCAAGLARLGRTWMPACLVLLVLWTGVSGLRCRRTVHQMAELFSTPKATEVSLLRERLAGLAPGSVVVSSQQWFGVIRGIRPDLVFVGAEGECRFSESPACVGRARFINELEEASGLGRPFASRHFEGRSLYRAHRASGMISVEPVMRFD